MVAAATAEAWEVVAWEEVERAVGALAAGSEAEATAVGKEEGARVAGG